MDLQMPFLSTTQQCLSTEGLRGNINNSIKQRSANINYMFIVPLTSTYITE